jgi:hypothetical protein
LQNPSLQEVEIAHLKRERLPDPESSLGEQAHEHAILAFQRSKESLELVTVDAAGPPIRRGRQ